MASNLTNSQQKAAPLLQVRDLKVGFKTRDGVVEAVRGVDFDLNAGEMLGIVGESGSGKSQTVLSLMGLLADNGQVSGSVKLDGQELLGLGTRQLNAIRGDQMAMIFQDPMTCLNPYLTIARQMTEVLQLHRGWSKKQALARSIELLDAVQIPEAARRIQRYPHEFSGGMRQRVMIAMALLCEPKLLIADEPTTALDVTVQAQILKLLDELRTDFNTAIVLITHDLGVVAGTCERALVMYAGRVIERAAVTELFARPSHPYSQGLLASLPSLATKGQKLQAIPGNPPTPMERPAGCEFAPRCSQRFDACEQVPQLRPASAAADMLGSRAHAFACHLDVAQ